MTQGAVIFRPHNLFFFFFFWAGGCVLGRKKKPYVDIPRN